MAPGVSSTNLIAPSAYEEEAEERQQISQEDRGQAPGWQSCHSSDSAQPALEEAGGRFCDKVTEDKDMAMANWGEWG